MARFSDSRAGVFIQGGVGGPRAEGAVAVICEELGIPSSQAWQKIVRALAAVRLGTAAEEAAKHLDWKEFESFCAMLLRASGYSVRENVLLRRPRAQIDIVASGPSMVLSIDCKHWQRAHPPSVLAGFAEAQKKRSAAFRRAHPEVKPIRSVVLSFSEPEGRFVEGVAVVPIRTLKDFLETVESYPDLLGSC